MSFDDWLPTLSEKWREVPGGSDAANRRFSDGLMSPEDWTKLYIDAAELRGWWWRLYAGQFVGKNILEIGSGQGFDAIYFAENGARITCCDIVSSNLEIVQAAAQARGLTLKTVHITSVASFSSLPSDFEFVWCNGSLIHLPFEQAKEECAAVLPHLMPSGRWIELAYPRERWVREGSLPFDQWGRHTDGERTPWVEWYDFEKLKERLFPSRLLPVLDHRFHGDSYVWFDAQIAGQFQRSLCEPIRIPGQESLVAEKGLWRASFSMPLPNFAATVVTVDVHCSVTVGTVGLFLEIGGQQISREVYVEMRTGNQLIHLSTTMYAYGVQLSARNASALGIARYAIESICIREAL